MGALSTAEKQNSGLPTIMPAVKILICLILALPSNSLCQRIECDWAIEWLCGDKCVGEYNSCLCGNDTITLAESVNYNCCNQGPCFKEMDGNVKCHGLKHNWRVPCNGICKQDAEWGYTTISCADQTQCVKSVSLCRGIPVCQE